MTIFDSQPQRLNNIDAIVAFFSRGFKNVGPQLGIELEHILVHEDGSPLNYHGDHGVQWILEALAPHWDTLDRNRQGQLLGLAVPGATITLEPAAQLELSAGPFKTISEAESVFSAFETELFALCNPLGIRIETLGYHPTAKAADLELIPKERYEIMNRYLTALSPFGITMMRGSASTQVSIDFRNEEDALAKQRLAFALTPLIYLITDNAPVFEGVPRPHHCMRAEIWRYCDPDRCGIVPGIMEDHFSFERYASYVLDAPALIAIAPNGSYHETHKTFGELFAHRAMEPSDVEQALSMFFNDVRLKTYLEIRPADAMPLPYVMAYTELIKGIFYNDKVFQTLFALMESVDSKAIYDAISAVMVQGYGATVYGRPVSTLCDEVIGLALSALSDQEKTTLKPLASLVEKRFCLADRIIP